MKCISLQWQRGEKCLTYVCYRWLIAIFYTFSFINSVVFSIKKGELAYMFIYLTRWNLFGTMLAMILGAFLVTRYYKSPKASDNTTGAMKVYWFLSNISVVFSIVISAVYWMLLYKPEDTGLNNWLVHATNSVFLVIDLLIVKHPTRFSHFVYSMTGGTIYLLFSAAYPLLGGIEPKGHNYVYPILDWKNNTLMAATVGLGTVTFAGVCHVIVGMIHLIRGAIHRHVTSFLKNEQELPLFGRHGKK
jgi:hypothetical protein